MTTCQVEKTLRHDFFSRVGGVVRQGMETVIRDRVKALFDSRGGLSQAEFAAAIGTKPSWVSHFFRGSRPANDIHLLRRIARYFGVPVGYLLNETEPAKDAGAVTLLSAWATMDEKSRQAVLNLALMLRGHDDDTRTGSPPGSPLAHAGAGGTTKAPKKRR